MAEIRKFRPATGGDIAQALARAMGESVRPMTPGDGGPEKKPSPKPTTTTSVVTSGAIWDPFLKTRPTASGTSSATSSPEDATDADDRA